MVAKIEALIRQEVSTAEGREKQFLVEELVRFSKFRVWGEVSLILTVSEAANLLSISPNTVRKWSNNGLIPSFRVGSRQDRRFRREDVVKLLQNR